MLIFLPSNLKSEAPPILYGWVDKNKSILILGSAINGDKVPDQSREGVKIQILADSTRPATREEGYWIEYGDNNKIERVYLNGKMLTSWTLVIYNIDDRSLEYSKLKRRAGLEGGEALRPPESVIPRNRTPFVTPSHQLGVYFPRTILKLLPVNFRRILNRSLLIRQICQSNRDHGINFIKRLDLTLGLAVFSCHWLFKSQVSQLISYLLTYWNWSAASFEADIIWLMSYPAGLKLNCNLSEFFGYMYLWLINIWTTILEEGFPSVSWVTSIGSIFALFGFSSMIAFAIDILKVSTTHIRAFYYIASRLFSWSLTILASLFHLFRGRKWNILKDRLDSAEYDLDQLLLGTILFAVVFFMFPTLTVYYGLFLFVYIKLEFLICFMEILLICLTNVPRADEEREEEEEGRNKFILELDDHGNVRVMQKNSNISDLIRPISHRIKECMMRRVSWSNFRNILTGQRIFD